MASRLSPILLLDGGLGTTLEAPPYNVKLAASTPLWSAHLLIDAPDTILAVQTDFVKAGSNVLLTATYQASYEGFAATKRERNQSTVTSCSEFNPQKQGYDRAEASEYMRKAVAISREAFQRSPDSVQPKLVALSLGAYGACMIPSQEYTGKYEPASFQTVEELHKWHRERLDAFTTSPETWGKIDLIAFETIPVLNEIHAARQVMSTVNLAGKKWYISCVFPNDDLRLPDGSTVEEVARAMLQDERPELSKPWGVGINCTKVNKLEGLIDQFESAVAKIQEEQESEKKSADELQRPWLVLYPDGATNLVYNTSTQKWESKDGAAIGDRRWDEDVCQIVRKTQERGFWSGILVGGCCKTSPEDISSLRARVNAIQGTNMTS